MLFFKKREKKKEKKAKATEKKVTNLQNLQKHIFFGGNILRGESLLTQADAITDIYADEMVQTAIHRVAEAVSKCDFKSVKVQADGRITVNNDSINAVLHSNVNEFCTLKDFLYKITYILLKTKNCFIYWDYYVENGQKVTRGFYPIEPQTTTIYQSEQGDIWIELKNAANEVLLDMPYRDIIHIRRNFGEHDILGGNGGGYFGYGGERGISSILQNLRTMHVIKESIPKSLDASLSMKGVLSLKTVADIDKKEMTRSSFEEHLFKSSAGIVATDYEADFTPINIAATDIPSGIMDFLRTEILAPFGVSLPIYKGEFTDNDYTAFYQTTIEGILQAIEQAMTVVLFSPAEIAAGYKMKYYDKLVQSLSFDRRQQLAEMTKEDGLLSRDERRELLGYSPDGGETRVSLNYISKEIANAYQLDGAGTAKAEKVAGAEAATGTTAAEAAEKSGG